MSTSAELGVTARPGGGRGLLFLFAAALGWGLNWPVQKFLLTQMPPFSMRTACAVAAALIAFTVAGLRRERLSIPAGQGRILVLAAMLNYGLFGVLTVTSLLWLRAAEAVIFTYTMPIWTALLAWMIYGERLRPRRVVALMLGLCGIVVLVGAEPLDASRAKLPGFICALTAAWVFAGATVLSKHHPPRLPPLAGIGWQIAIGCVPAALLCATETVDLNRITLPGWIGLAYCAIVPMVLGYLAWFRALQLLPAATASLGTLIAPVVGVSGSSLLLGEPLGIRQLGALALTLSGVALAVRS